MPAFAHHRPLRSCMLDPGSIQPARPHYLSLILKLIVQRWSLCSPVVPSAHAPSTTISHEACGQAKLGAVGGRWDLAAES